MTDQRVRLVVLGGSAPATPKLVEAMGDGGARKSYDLVLFGRDHVRLELVARLCRHFAGRFGLDVHISTSTDLGESLEGAEYVLNQVRVGGLEGRLFDETFPIKYGIPGEETVGPGGFSSAMRGIPLMLGICREIEARAPRATLLNLTNPSSLIQYAIRRYSSVQVIGTCDAPVTLMETLAGILGSPVDVLDFDLAGMHHFSWIVGIREQQADRLGELMARLDELSFVGTDPEVIRAFQAIPSKYFKYYVHPDRVLAGAEGKPPRAARLMELGEEIQAGYRSWQAGEAPAMLDQRGAVWYHQIVAPALLSLAERRTESLVLSVDNGRVFSWLPEDAIVEARVPIVDGSPGEAVPVELPADLRALIAQNCAYEQLAVEAIVEEDRPKALRALLSNLMVHTYTQASGMLDELWPARGVARLQTSQSSKTSK